MLHSWSCLKPGWMGLWSHTWLASSPACSRGTATWWSFRSLPTQAILQQYLSPSNQCCILWQQSSVSSTIVQLHNLLLLALLPVLIKSHTFLKKIKATSKWREIPVIFPESVCNMSYSITLYHMQNHFIPFQCMVHMHIMVFALWNHRGVRIVSFSAFPYWWRIRRTGTTKIRCGFYTQSDFHLHLNAYRSFVN